MKIFKLSQSQNEGWDTFDSLIVVADSEEEARLIHPAEEYEIEIDWGEPYSSWCSSPNDVKVEYLGEAKEGTKKGIILTSYNAG